MFTLKDIKDAHSMVKSGADFQNYVRDLIKLGIKKYDFFVRDGHALYFGDNDYQLKSKPAYKVLNIANISDKERFKHYLKNHQRGQTDYNTFCKDAAVTGVEKWTVDMAKMSCTYYDKFNNIMMEEQIATPLYINQQPGNDKRLI